MPGMPYHLEKGPILSVLESFANGGNSTSGTTRHNNMRKVLDRLRDPSIALTAVGGLDSTNLNGGATNPWPTYDDRVAHIEQDWFGYTPGGVPQAAFNPSIPHRTGFWINYHGDVEGIVRETLTRALEVALGVDHGQPSSGATRYWRVELFWKCPNPWFEGWITWRAGSASSADGQVTVIFATPGNGGWVYPDPCAGRNPVVDPASAQTDRGMWVITHRGHTEYVVSTTVETPPGAVPIPTLGAFWAGTAPLVTVAPSFGDGGGHDGGLPYGGGAL
ncbi:MAG TPA: hypothetical protein VMT43_09625 [Acidimicrobiales bacterium]|nr:hypothetical protein [Acidimicrobiales bacterium]